MIRKILLLASLALLSCQGNGKYRSLKYHEQEMPSPAVDVQLPTKLWLLFENPTLEVRNENAPQKQTEFMGLKVYLYERNRGLLGGENHRLIFPPAGGELDLREFVQDKSGSYYFAVEPISKALKPDLKVYFLSNGQERKLGNETYGAGCNTYFDITSSFRKAMEKEGFLLNTTDQRDISAIAGTFFFVIDDGQRMQLARLTVKDTRYPSLHCKK